MSIVVSSLTRIHNETGFAMELRFQRREHNDNEIASALLKSGETIDDSVAMFDAVSLSGGLKKALVSISVGMHWNSSSLSLSKLQIFQVIHTSFHYSISSFFLVIIVSLFFSKWFDFYPLVKIMDKCVLSLQKHISLVDVNVDLKLQFVCVYVIL